MSLLVVEGLGIKFGGLHAVKDVGFTLKSGEIVSIIGPNGAGKTTLFNMISGIYLPLDDNNDINLAVSQGKKLDEVMKGWFADNADLMKRWSNIKKD